ncbi:hypothetical protein R6Q59_005672 [Mikania micrantha]
MDAMECYALPPLCTSGSATKCRERSPFTPLLLELYKNIDGVKKEIIHSIVITSMWCLWRMRNDIVFNGGKPSVHRLIEEVKRTSFLWLMSRAKSLNLGWEDWPFFHLS